MNLKERLKREVHFTNRELEFGESKTFLKDSAKVRTGNEVILREKMKTIEEELGKGEDKDLAELEIRLKSEDAQEGGREGS